MPLILNERAAMFIPLHHSKNRVATAHGSDTNAANVIPVIETMPADLLTPLSVYLKLSVESTNSFLLESVEGGKSLARYSFIGADPESVLRSNENTEASTFESLKKHFSTRKSALALVSFLEIPTRRTRPVPISPIISLFIVIIKNQNSSFIKE